MVTKLLSLQYSSFPSQFQHGQATDHWKQETSGIWLPKTLIYQPSNQYLQQETKKPDLNQVGPDDHEAWIRYWTEQGQPWRREPEIPRMRQEGLTQRRCIRVDLEQGIYPFKDMHLSRADVEWLLATHDNERGPIDWSSASQRERLGVDLRGANLKGVDLSKLPLTCVRGGLTQSERGSDKQWKRRCEEAAIHLENSKLIETHLEGANLQFAYLEGADINTAHLEGARLYNANLTGANLRYAFFDRTSNLDSIGLNNASVADVRWGDVNIALIAWERIEMLGDECKAIDQKVPKRNSTIQEKNEWLRVYRRAIRANRQVATILRNQGWNEKANELDYCAQVLQRKLLFRQGWWRRIGLFASTRPSRRRSIGMIMSSSISWLLDAISGYGFKPWRWIYFYLSTILVFALLHYFVDIPHLTPLDALFVSIQSLHGHSFPTPSNVQGAIKSFEAILGLFIEAILISIIVQRILGESGA